MKRYAFLIVTALALTIAIAIGNNAIAGEKCCLNGGKAKIASSCEKACAKDCKDNSQCSQACDTKACVGKAQAAGTCKADCTDKTACTDKKGVPCKPGECKPSDCKMTPGK